jgi:succinoglycan biosynthesis protein ExoA
VTPAGGDEEMCSILVPVLNEQRHVAATVAAMRAQRFRGRLEFLLIDGGSTDGTRELLAALALEDPRIRVLSNPRGAIPSGLNVGLRHARGRWIARMDAHARYPADYVRRGIERLRRGGTTWVSGPQIPVGEGPVGRAQALALRGVLGRGGSGRWGAGAATAADEYQLDSGVFCGVWERDTLLAHGGWDERWARNEDSEMAARFFERGETLICAPAMAAEYSPRDSLPALWRQYVKNGEFRAMTARRHPETLRRSNLLPPALALTWLLAAAGPRPLRKPARLALAGYGTVLAGAGARATAEAERPIDAVLVPVVLAVMHTAFGAGFLRGVVRHGPPLAALATATGRARLAGRWARPAESVFAPSLVGRTGAAGP